MGCFEVADGVSGITIKPGDKCGILLMVPDLGWPHTSNREIGSVTISSTTNLVLSDGPMGVYRPYCLPVWGEYNDYGTLENIERDMTVEGLEKYFGATIDELFSMIGNSSRSIFEGYGNMLSVYGNGLNIEYHDAPNEKWLLKAGFRKVIKTKDKALIKLAGRLNKDRKSDNQINPENLWILTGTPITKVFNKETKEWVHTDFPVCWFELAKEEVFKSRGEEPIVRTFYADGEVWKDTYDRTQKDFCETVMKRTKYGFFGTGEGIQLGIKKEHWKRVLEIRSLSGMFIDKEVYNQLTLSQLKEKGGRGFLDNTYPNKYMMPPLGFEFVKFVNSEYPTETIEDDGLPLTHRVNRDIIYKHPSAPEYYFGVSDRSMSVDLYDLDMKNLDRANKMFGNKYSMSTFSPNGIKKMLEKITGTTFEVEQLLELPERYFYYEKMKEYMGRIENKEAKMKELDAKKIEVRRKE